MIAVIFFVHVSLIMLIIWPLQTAIVLGVSFGIPFSLAIWSGLSKYDTPG